MRFLLFSILSLLFIACQDSGPKPFGSPSFPNEPDFYLNSVELVSLPANPPGEASWDPMNGDPDIFFRLKDFTGRVYYDLPLDQVKEDLSQSELPYKWDLRSAEIRLHLPGRPLHIEFYDMDGDLENYIVSYGPIYLDEMQTFYPIGEPLNMNVSLFWRE
ncbi:MAG: hypothetical protein AAF206_03155 [Bacteroidota bacterium]